MAPFLILGLGFVARVAEVGWATKPLHVALFAKDEPYAFVC